MKLSQLMTLNGLVYIALGIGFALYGPVLIPMFGVLRFGGQEAGLYWYVASFARLFGAALFGFGFLIWAVRSLGSQPRTAVEEPEGGLSETRRGIIFALLLSNLLSLFVVITQQYSVWASAGGWILIGITLLLCLGYGYFLAKSSLKVGQERA